MAPRRIIIDTDPGVDDVLAMLLAFSALPDELEVLLLSITYGNIDLQNCLRNVVSMFFHIEKEIAWRKAQGQPIGFETLRHHRPPLVAVGPEKPLADQILMADFFHGKDGLGGIHESHPHLSPTETWKELFDKASADGASNDPIASADITTELQKTNALFTPSRLSASDEILRLLRENEPDTITIVAVGPLTNLALAASREPETFLRAKEVVVMGGTLAESGNITPVAEFNTFADAVAAARVYALSSPNPSSTMPPSLPINSAEASLLSSHNDNTSSLPPPLGPYPTGLTRQLQVTLFPLDITNHHVLSQGQFSAIANPLLAKGSPLAEWTAAFVNSTFQKIASLSHDPAAATHELDVLAATAASGISPTTALQLHDPLCIWYCMATDPTSWELSPPLDIRVETSGQWTRGLTLVDRRPRRRRAAGDDGEKPGDTGNWLSDASGNRMRVAVNSPGREEFAGVLMQRVFGL